MADRSDFDQWFVRATGKKKGPYAYQRSLAERDRPPSVLEVPTGCGKTQAVIGAWLYQRRRGGAPRRLVYALPMRTLVEQTAAAARAMLKRLELTDEVAVNVLMGGSERDATDWRLRPEADQIVVGTIDMLLSRALNRGYAEGRFSWPIAFGLLNSDCRWIFDEVQLMGPARATSAQLDGLRATLGTALPCETLWVSATVDSEALQTVDRPDLGEVMRLPQEDRSGRLQVRLNATKVAERVDLAATATADVPKHVARLCAERHIPGTRTIAVLNTVKEAQATFKALRRELRDDGPGVVLLHSRFRPPDRAHHMDVALGDPPHGGTIVVSTQVLEAGVDVTSTTLVTALAPFSSIVQRLGRCNREGNDKRASAMWLDRGELADDASSRKLAAPYAPGDLERSRLKLLELEDESLSPTRLEEMDVEETREAPATLRRRDLLDLFDTAPDLSGTDIDIAPFIRPDDGRTSFAFFRDRSAGPPTKDDPVPAAEEIVQVPRIELVERARWVPDHVSGTWVRLGANQRPPPGATVMLDATEGGYDHDLGWASTLTKRRVEPTFPDLAERVEGLADDNHGGSPEELAVHLKAVADAAAQIADALGLEAWRAELTAAAGLHDIGKAHETFQALMRKAIGAAEDDDRLWAKSGTTGGRYGRRYFRHELASAIALTRLGGDIAVPHPPLTRYLVAAHHGRVRVAIRPAPGESAPREAPDSPRFALGIVDGDELPAMDTPLGRTRPVTLALDSMELGAEDSWVNHALALRDDPALGPFRLGLLEAVVRMADWRVSGA